MSLEISAKSAEDEPAQSRLCEFLLYFLDLAAFGFWGPIALAGLLVEGQA